MRCRRTTAYENSFSEDTLGTFKFKFKFQAYSDMDGRLKLSMQKAFANAVHLVLKSTIADTSTLHLAPIVIDEIRVQGSRCGPFAPALRALSQRRIDVLPLISARYSLNEGLDAFDHAGKKGTLKVLVKI